jgi:curli biogenesis system outer membrane secretion channel CsgG
MWAFGVTGGAHAAGFMDRLKGNAKDEPAADNATAGEKTDAGKTAPVAVGTAIEKAPAKGAGNLRYSVSVNSFDHEYTWSGPYDIASAFHIMLTDALQTSGHFIVLGDQEMRQEAMKEQDLVASGRTAQGAKAPKTGRMTPAQLLVKGAITHVQDDTSGGSGGIGFKGISLGGSGGSAEINMTIYLMDTETGQVKASQKITGTAKKRGLGIGYSGSGLGGLTGDLAGFKNDNVGKATENAMAQAVEFLTKQLETIPWQGSVALIKDGKIMLNRGTREGVSVGQTFVVGKTEQVVDDDTGEVLDNSMTQVGRLEVTEVKEKVSYCKALEGEDKIEKGMSVQPASAP